MLQQQLERKEVEGEQTQMLVGERIFYQTVIRLLGRSVDPGLHE